MPCQRSAEVPDDARCEPSGLGAVNPNAMGGGQDLRLFSKFAWLFAGVKPKMGFASPPAYFGVRSGGGRRSLPWVNFSCCGGDDRCDQLGPGKKKKKNEDNRINAKSYYPVILMSSIASPKFQLEASSAMSVWFEGVFDLKHGKRHREHDL